MTGEGLSDDPRCGHHQCDSCSNASEPSRPPDGESPQHLDAVTRTVTQGAHPAFTTRQPGSFMLSLEAPEYLSAARETPDESTANCSPGTRRKTALRPQAEGPATEADPEAPGGAMFPVPPLPCQRDRGRAEARQRQSLGELNQQERERYMSKRGTFLIAGCVLAMLAGAVQGVQAQNLPQLLGRLLPGEVVNTGAVTVEGGLDQIDIAIVDTARYVHIRARVVGSGGIEFVAGYCEEDRGFVSAGPFDAYGSSGNGFRYCDEELWVRCPSTDEPRFKAADCAAASPMRVRVEATTARIWEAVESFPRCEDGRMAVLAGYLGGSVGWDCNL